MISGSNWYKVTRPVSVYNSYTCTKAEYNIYQEQDNKKKDG